MKIRNALQGWRVFFALSLIATMSIVMGEGARAGSKESPEVSVRLRSLKGAVSVTGTSLIVGTTPVESLRLSFVFIKPTDGVGDGVWDVLDAVSGQSILKVSSAKIEIRGEGLRVDLRPAPSHIQLVARRKSGELKMNLVGFLTIEDYLQGVVATEVPRDWPDEALKAQAVAARSFTVAKIRERKVSNPDWLLESNVMDQVFDFERIHTRASDAVRATAGEVLLSANDQVIAANYHSDCGGRTDEPGVIWGGGSRTGTAVDRSCAGRPRNPWRVVSSFPELERRLSSRRLLPVGFQMASLQVIERTTGGRALILEAVSSAGRKQRIAGERLRESLGYSEMKSTMFELKPRADGRPGEIEFTGRGFGHGAGLCQWGSRQMAASGRTYLEILRHYYPLLKVMDLRSSLTEPGLQAANP